MRASIASLRHPDSFARRAGGLVGATTLGQAITIGASPILTRLYSPPDFGLMALFASIAAVLVAFGTAQYHTAIVLPDDDGDGYAILAGSSLLALMTGALAIVAALIANSFTTVPPRLAAAIGIYVVSLGVSESLQHWLMRRTQFGMLARVRLAIVVLTTGLSLMLGFYRYDAGLILAAVIGQLLPTIYLGIRVIAAQRQGQRAVSGGAIRRVFTRYSDFPRYAVPAELLNTAAYQMPTLLITRWFDVATTGLYSLTQRVLSMPTALVSRAVLDVFKQRASSDYSRDGNAAVVFRKTFISLATIGVPAFLLLAIVAPPLFAWAFGEQWREAGEYARLLAPMFAFRFIASPLSYMLIIAEAQRLNLALQAMLVVVTAGSLAAGLKLGSVKAGLILFSASYSLVYVVCLVLSWNLARGKART